MRMRFLVTGLLAVSLLASPSLGGLVADERRPTQLAVVFDGGIPDDLDRVASSLGSVVALRNDVLLPFVSLEFPTPERASLASALLSARPGVRAVFPVQLATLEGPLDSVPALKDALRDRQWGLAAIRAPEAWASMPLASVPTPVGVLDTGVACEQPDLAAACAGPSYDLWGHGTHVAGIVGATRQNAIGIAGVADALVVPIRVFSDAPNILAANPGPIGTSPQVAAGVLQATASGARVISMSFSFPGFDGLVNLALRIAAASDVVLVAAAGNHPCTDPNPGVRYPASDPLVVAVASVDSGLGVSCFSNQGGAVELAAPGGGILSTYSHEAWLYVSTMHGLWGRSFQPSCVGFFSNVQFKSQAESGRDLRLPEDMDPREALYYCHLSGTSMATPHVSGVAALVRSACPTLDADAVRGILVATARDLAAPGHDDATGHGIVDAKEAVEAALAACPEP
ncbi:MAG TPA: S8 family serine peptidase [Candidatus Thermoplasmatota archaeon]|nr:S8 family serine peptidase [Candidatus Thermoplasmatota archaeon]